MAQDNHLSGRIYFIYSMYEISKMKDRNEFYLKAGYLLFVLLPGIKAILKLFHKPLINGFLFAIFFLTYLFLIRLAILEVINSERIERHEKIMWVISFIFLTWFSVLIYIFFARKRIVSFTRNHIIPTD